MMAPAPGANGLPRGYFRLPLAPGRSATDIVVFSNDGPVTLRFRVGVTVGVTASDSGSAFGALGTACAGTACWVTGIPRVVTLPPHSQDGVQFRVTVQAQHGRPSTSRVSPPPRTCHRSRPIWGAANTCLPECSSSPG